MEAHMGRKLKRGEVVHHIDYDKTNNSVENLQVMTRVEHARLHGQEDRKIRARRTQQRKSQFYVEQARNRASGTTGGKPRAVSTPR